MMNERIRELKAQARDFYLSQEDLDCSITELHELVDTKFALLIAEECVNICISLGDDDSADYIERHFGVEL
jgi:hypothetical protein